MAAPPIDNNVLSVLACPKCKNEVTLAHDERGLVCEACRVVYPVRDGVPVMLVEEAYPFRSDRSPPEGGEKMAFLVVEGKNKGDRIELSKATCRAIGRSLDEVERTKVFSVDSAVSLDDASKKLVIHYVAKQFQKKGLVAEKKGPGEELGGFVRGPDYQILDLAVSRLHAMIFHDESGIVGILDLVSKNGTFVNGAEVESKILKQGDLITIGNTKIRLE